MNLSPFLLTPFFVIIGRSGGLIVPFFIAHFYGVSRETDAFFFANGIIMFLWGVFQQVFETVLLPYLAEQKRKSAGHMFFFVRRVLYTVLPLLALVCIGLKFFLPRLLSATSGLDPDMASLVTLIYTFLVPFLLMTVFVSAVNGILNTYKVFWFPAVSPLIRSLVIVAFMFLFHDKLGIHAISAGFVGGEFLRWAVSLYLLFHLGLWTGKNLAAPSDGQGDARSFWGQSVYQVFALGAVQLIPLLNQWYASWLGVGDLSMLNYADRLYQIPFQLFLAGQSQIFLSHWADSYYEQSKTDFRRRVQRDMAVTLGVVTLFAAGCWLSRGLLVRLSLGFGEVKGASLESISSLFGVLIMGLAPAVINTLLLRVLFVMRQSAGFMAQSVIKLGLQLLLNGLLMKVYGLQGIAIATMLNVTVTTLGLYAYILFLWKRQSV
ncbi:MAG TPA: lipid II flippase MurJ [Verrucomicrobiae bacterium]|nr:lipid II flippase MurJ [Verrucomicrobiae bacterium]